MKAKDLKNSILQMAIEGKLVPQDPNDEPASVLLERIREEKHKLIAEGKAKFPKGGESIIYIGSDGSPYEKRVDAKGHVTSDKCIANEMPFEELPEGWCWTRLSNVASIQLGKMLDKQKNQGDLAPYLGNANVQWGRFDLANVKTMPMDEMDRAKYALSDGDLIVCEGGVPGRCAIWTSNETMHYQKALHRIRCSKRLLLNTYCELYICFIVQSHVWDSCFTGTTIKHLPAQTLSSSFTRPTMRRCSARGGRGRMKSGISPRLILKVWVPPPTLTFSIHAKPTGESMHEQIHSAIAMEIGRSNPRLTKILNS